jgi:hypothetical protein
MIQFTDDQFTRGRGDGGVVVVGELVIRRVCSFRGASQQITLERECESLRYFRVV